MAVTYEPIASQTLGSNAASVTFSSIPGTYTDLVLVMFYRDTRAANYSYPAMRMNNDSGSNYSATYLWGSGSAATSSRLSNTSAIANVGEGAGGTSPTGEFATINVQIMNYSNASTNKTVLISSGNYSGSGGGNIGRHVGLWRSTNAITRVDILADNAIAAGSTFSLYGIKAA